MHLQEIDKISKISHLQLNVEPWLDGHCGRADRHRGRADRHAAEPLDTAAEPIDTAAEPIDTAAEPLDTRGRADRHRWEQEEVVSSSGAVSISFDLVASMGSCPTHSLHELWLTSMAQQYI